MDELQTGIEFALAVLPQPAAFLQPSERSLDNPPLRYHLESVQFVAFGDLYSRSQAAQHFVRELFTRIGAIRQNAFHRLQIVCATLKSHHRSFPITDFRRRDRHSMRESLRIHSQMTLDPRDFLACVVTLAVRGIAILHALRVDDQKAWRDVPLQFRAGRANPIFLMPTPAGFFPHHRPHARS